MKSIFALGFSTAACALAIACSTTSTSIPKDATAGTDSTGTDDTVADSGKKASKDSGTTEDFELVGTWETSFAGTAIITNTTWNEFSELKIVSYDNDKNIAILQNPPANADAGLSPDKFSVNVWIDPAAGVTYYCTVDFDLDTEAEALASTKSADAEDLEGKGCGGFPWTKLTKK